jgi:N6-adenosine-specific RNA methylase IME4
LPLEKLRALPVPALAAPDSALFIWSVWPNLPAALDLIAGWGFEYKTAAFLWVKTAPSAECVALDGGGLHWGIGYHTRANTEPCLIGLRGSPLRLAIDVHQVVVAPVGAHSAKPDEVARRIERLYPGPRLELFARKSRDGWTTWGNEIPPLDAGWAAMWGRPFDFRKLEEA